MRRLAQAAGVTAATVSMALRDSPRIRPETRIHVQEVAKRLGYYHVTGFCMPIVFAVVTGMRLELLLYLLASDFKQSVI
jgi:LacI family transcriptional regulator